MPKLITEAGTLTAPSATGKLMITLITPGWGSSGYYSDKVLEQAAKDKVFPAGTQMHIDHMSSSDEWERPAGSLTTLAAVLEEDAVWDPAYVDEETGKKGRLAAPALLGSKYRPEITEFAKYIGTSVAVGVDIKAGEAEGRRGQIIEAMYPHKLNRVDFVTVAGRGGKIDKVIEALASKAHEVTANDLRSQLRELVRTAYGDDQTYVWLEDHDDSNVWFSLEDQVKATTYQVGYTVTDDVATLSGDSTEVRKVTQYVPITQASEAATGNEFDSIDLPQVGDRVVIDPERLHDPAHNTGTIAEIGTTAYGLVMDGMPEMGVHRWYTADEFGYEDDTAMGMEAKKRRKKKMRGMPGMETPKNSPPVPAGVTENQEEATMATIDDKELATLRESASRAAALESENTTLKTENATLVRDGRTSAAEAIVAEAFGDIEAKTTRTSLVRAALASEAFNLDELKATAVEAVAEIRAERGEGNVHGAGVTGSPAREAAVEVSDADILKALKGGK